MARDWHFGFVSWNYVFRSAINLSRTWFAYTSADEEGGRKMMTPEEIGEGAKKIFKALRATYRDMDNKKKERGRRYDEGTLRSGLGRASAETPRKH